ncbi:MAG: sugar ABC transporter ATP-binding protein [Microbacterium sp.]
MSTTARERPDEQGHEQGVGSRDTTPGFVLSAHRVVKSFGSTRALRGVDFGVRAGEIVGLVGANGAGKSTLISVLSGSLAPTSGELRVDGEPVRFASPEAAAHAGVATVQQDVDLALVPTLSVAENLVLDLIARGALGALPSARRIRETAAEVAGGRLDLDLNARVGALRTSEKQLLLIARALHRGARVLILDEPTAALSIAEQRELHDRVREAAAAGTAVVYITHHLGELAEICDRVVVLRDGDVEGEALRPIEPDAIADLMLGSLARHHRLARTAGAPVLVGRGIRALPDATPFDLTLCRGEVLGITGLLGAGKSELLSQLVGVSQLATGELTLDGEPYRPRTIADAIAAGVGFVPEDRRVLAEVPSWSLAQNLTLPDLGRYTRLGLVSRRRERAAAAAAIDRLDIVAAGPGAAIESLSGGNRQKVIVARWISARSRVLILDEPFRGVDLGARADIARLLRSGDVDAAIVASSDPEEILEVADRILVLAGGALIAELTPDAVDAAALGTLIAPVAPVSPSVRPGPEGAAA